MFGYLESWFSSGGMRGWGIHRPEEGSKTERETFQSGTRTNFWGTVALAGVEELMRWCCVRSVLRGPLCSWFSQVQKGV